MATVLNTTFRLKRGTAARWAEVNPILDQGEPGFVYDANRLKIGDGKTPWNDLPYIEGKFYTAGVGLELVGNEFKTKLADGSEGFLTITTDGIKLSGVANAIATAKSEAIAIAESVAVEVVEF